MLKEKCPKECHLQIVIVSYAVGKGTLGLLKSLCSVRSCTFGADAQDHNFNLEEEPTEARERIEEQEEEIRLHRKKIGFYRREVK